MDDTVTTHVSFESGASSWERFSLRFSSLYVPALFAAAHISKGERVLDVATGTGPSAVQASGAIGQSGCVIATDLSIAMLERAKPKTEHLPISLAVMDAQALACKDSSFDAVICHLGLVFLPNMRRGLEEFLRVLRSGGRMAVSVTTTPERNVFGRVFLAARRFLPTGHTVMNWNFAVSDPSALGALISAVGFREVTISKELRAILFESPQDYWATLESGCGLSGATYVALSPEHRRVVRDEMERIILPLASDEPFTVESEVLIGFGRC